MTFKIRGLNRTGVVSTGAILLLLVLYSFYVLQQVLNTHMTSPLPTSAISSTICQTVLPGEDHATSPTDDSEPENSYTPAEKAVTSKGATTQTDAPTPSAAPSTHEEGQWSFNTTRDERAYGLAAEQCDAAFPGLFTEIDRAVEYRKKVGKITPDDVDISWKDYGAVRAAIINQQVSPITFRSPSLSRDRAKPLYTALRS